MEKILSCFQILKKYLKVGLLRSKCYFKYSTLYLMLLLKKQRGWNLNCPLYLKNKYVGVTHFSNSTYSLLHINFMLLGVLFSSARLTETCAWLSQIRKKPCNKVKSDTLKCQEHLLKYSQFHLETNEFSLFCKMSRNRVIVNEWSIVYTLMTTNILFLCFCILWAT